MQQDFLTLNGHFKSSVRWAEEFVSQSVLNDHCITGSSLTLKFTATTKKAQGPCSWRNAAQIPRCVEDLCDLEDHTLQTVQGYKAGGRDFFSEASIELLQQLVPNTSENRNCMRNQYT